MTNANLSLPQCRENIRQHYLADESTVIKKLVANANLSSSDRIRISEQAAELIRDVRSNSKPSMMEKFLAQYGLNTKEGIALMCLAEALLRVPDKISMDALIEDKVASGQWGDHLGKSNSSLINSSTWALLITGKLIAPVEQKSLSQTLRTLTKRLGEPVVRTAVAQVMKEMGSQFVLGRTIDEALKRARKYESQGYTYSYDMLGEAARTDADALRYHQSYANTITELSSACAHEDLRKNPGISVKLSALHPRYEYTQKERVINELVPRTLELAKLAKAANMGFNIDAEEADRLDLSLDVIEAVLSDPSLQGWDGFGVVVQAFGQRASYVLDWLYALTEKLDRKIMIRLVKGAYWDAEIKRAQTMGLEGFPVFTRKVNSDISYITCAKKLHGMTDRIYPQFATHNAHSAAAILELFKGQDNFEFQRLHGMGESLHQAIVDGNQVRCRIYAPVGAHQDLLAYLVRRLLENGANSSFVNQIVDDNISPEEIAKDPFLTLEALGESLSSNAILKPSELYGSMRNNAKGWDITNSIDIETIEAGRTPFKNQQWNGGPTLPSDTEGNATKPVYNPADSTDLVGYVRHASAEDIEKAIAAAEQGYQSWSAISAEERGKYIRRAVDLFETHAYELFALATREAGKNLLDAIAEIREAVDFGRYYPIAAEQSPEHSKGRGIISCISPWNFPLAIFAGQVFSTLAAGNVVIAKPADQTILIAARAVELMHEAGIPKDAIQLLPGSGATVGTALTSDARISGVCFTGSTATAQKINKVMAENLPPNAPLLAETGGLNAMIVDSTALPEQVVRDVLASSFQSAGQRCSALRVLFLQEDIADHLLEMLYGAMDELNIDNPWSLSTDIGPVIDKDAQNKIDQHCKKFHQKGRVLKKLQVPNDGTFVAPTVIKLDSIDELEDEIFGPVLHVVTFHARDIDKVVDQINNKGFGLTFGLHTRVDNRVSQIIERIKVGNIYVNRNQIGAIVGSQPFGGEGLSGTGPKAGGPQYVQRFMATENVREVEITSPETVDAQQLQQVIDSVESHSWGPAESRAALLTPTFGSTPRPLDTMPESLPGPTGESNLLSCHPRGLVLCLGPDNESILAQAGIALSQGNAVVMVAPKAEELLSKLDTSIVPAVAINGLLQPEALIDGEGFVAVTSAANSAKLQEYRIALSKRNGALLPLITEQESPERFIIERHLCVDTTAAGGNASLMAASE